MTPFVRIALRYIAMALVARGWLTETDASTISADAELIAMIEVGVGAALATVTELWHWFERKWKKP